MTGAISGKSPSKSMYGFSAGGLGISAILANAGAIASGPNTLVGKNLKKLPGGPKSSGTKSIAGRSMNS